MNLRTWQGVAAGPESVGVSPADISCVTHALQKASDTGLCSNRCLDHLQDEPSPSLPDMIELDMTRSQSKGTKTLCGTWSARDARASDHCRCYIPPPEVSAARKRNARLRISAPVTTLFPGLGFVLVGRYPARTDQACHWRAHPGVRPCWRCPA